MAKEKRSGGIAKEEVPAGKKKAKKGRGHFFAVERGTWEHICDGLTFNSAIAFLVLASGSGADNITTSWSAKSVHTYTGMSRERATLAIQELQRHGFLECVKPGTKPQYKIKSPKIPKQKTALKLERIWLPNALVTGARNELPPLARLRATQDISLLRLFIDLYRAHNLLDEGGISRTVLYKDHERIEIGRRGQYVIYGFNAHGPTACMGSEVLKRHYGGGDKKIMAEFWERLTTLETYGLIKWVTYLCETDVAGGGELIHPCTYDPDDESPTLEKQIGGAAHEAAEAIVHAMVEDGHGGADYRTQGVFQLVPVPQQYRQATLIDIALLTYRPRTSKTSVWRGKFESEGNHRLEEFRSLKEHFSPEQLRERALI